MDTREQVARWLFDGHYQGERLWETQGDATHDVYREQADELIAMVREGDAYVFDKVLNVRINVETQEVARRLRAADPTLTVTEQTRRAFGLLAYFEHHKGTADLSDVLGSNLAPPDLTPEGEEADEES